jgi:hypothetical protein
MLGKYIELKMPKVTRQKIKGVIGVPVDGEQCLRAGPPVRIICKTCWTSLLCTNFNRHRQTQKHQRSVKKREQDMQDVEEDEF